MSILRKILCGTAMLFAAAAFPQAACSYEPGDILQFGNYPYREDGSKQPISWILLNKYSDGTALLLTENAIDSIKYNETRQKTSWENSTIREWLNQNFIENAFSDEEKKFIVPMLLENRGNTGYGIAGGKPTKDMAFLLSIAEAGMLETGKRKAALTPYAESNMKAMAKAAKKKINNNCNWWLRSHGGGEEYAAYVRQDGEIYDGGRYVNAIAVSVRPAIKFNLEEYTSAKNAQADAENGLLPENTGNEHDDKTSDDDSPQEKEEQPAEETVQAGKDSLNENSSDADEQNLKENSLENNN